jgi:tetratricopeptide (TPR) repeat protein
MVRARIVSPEEHPDKVEATVKAHAAMLIRVFNMVRIVVMSGTLANRNLHGAIFFLRLTSLPPPRVIVYESISRPSPPLRRCLHSAARSALRALCSPASRSVAHALMNALLARSARLAMLICCLSGCSELRGRRRVREGNRLYREGRYPAALREYREAEGLCPDLPLLWLNEGLACRQMMTPGSKGPESHQATDCAVHAFERMRQVNPSDPRAEQLYVQTLFDGDRFDLLVSRYTSALEASPTDLSAITGLIQVATRANRPDEALRWFERKASLLPRDAEAQYAVGVYAWQQLYQRGGGPDKASYDPRADPIPPGEAAVSAGAARPAETTTGPAGQRKRRSAGRAPAPVRKPSPPFAVGDLTGPARVKLANLGIVYLERALALRPQYQEAMVYLNLLHRQKSMAFLDEPSQWQGEIDAAEIWRKRAAEAKAL